MHTGDDTTTGRDLWINMGDDPRIDNDLWVNTGTLLRFCEGCALPPRRLVFSLVAVSCEECLSMPRNLAFFARIPAAVSEHESAATRRLSRWSLLSDTLGAKEHAVRFPFWGHRLRGVDLRQTGGGEMSSIP